MAILNFSDVLKKVGLDPKRVKLIRHSLADKEFNKCYKENMVMLSRLVDTFFSRTSWTMLLYAENHSISVA